MEMIEPVLLVHIKDALVGQMKPTEVIKLMIINGWSTEKLKYQFNFDAALNEIKHQAKWN